MGLFDSIKAAISGSTAADEAYYEVVARELSNGSIRPGLWAKALAETGYDELKAKARYIQLRVEVLEAEVGQLRNELESEERVRRQMLADEQHRMESDALPAYRRGDYSLAFRGFTLLAQKGQPWAQYNLAYMLENGQGIARDLSAAIDWYKKAANQNDKDAQFSLGRICLHTFSDYESSQTWFSMAERNGHPDAQRMKKQATEFIKAQKKLLK
ncbi:Sel1 repeat protein [Azoarcus sp. Aa7]|nr:Sel1 repeat protein [Azoarcus sp. Aa7]